MNEEYEQTSEEELEAEIRMNAFLGADSAKEQLAILMFGSDATPEQAIISACLKIPEPIVREALAAILVAWYNDDKAHAVMQMLMTMAKEALERGLEDV